ncbi:hypothetical protein, partial [Oleiagrimonas sp.]|uniref:hypothetical protein n=1 Tax=Oleiagrimonas sp. TaxID=2010330 RepID=UPI0026397647
MSTRLPVPTHTFLLALRIGLACAVWLPGTAISATPARDNAAPAVTCALGSLSCPPRPISYAMCRPNALLSFYQYGLPADARG